MSLVNNRVESLSDSLHQRTEAIRAGSGPDEPEDVADRDESDEPAEEDEDEEWADDEPEDSYDDEPEDSYDAGYDEEADDEADDDTGDDEADDDSGSAGRRRSGGRRQSPVSRTGR
jgi:hypothetical protein